MPASQHKVRLQIGDSEAIVVLTERHGEKIRRALMARLADGSWLEGDWADIHMRTRDTVSLVFDFGFNDLDIMLDGQLEALFAAKEASR